MKRIILFISIFILGFSSCKEDVLDKVPLDIISEYTVWNAQILMDAFLTQAYSEVQILTNEAADWVVYKGVYIGEAWIIAWSDRNGIADEGRNQFGEN